MMLAQELSERDHANHRAISAEIPEQVPAAAVLLSSDEAHFHISGAVKKNCFYVLFRNIYDFFLDSFFHFLYLFKMWEIFMPHPVYICELWNDCIEYFFIQYFYRQSTTFIHNLFLKMCMKVEMYESQAVDSYGIRGVTFWLLKLLKSSPFMGNKQKSCTNNYNTFMREINRR